MSAALSGCAIGSVGTLAAHVQRHDNVSVLSIYSVGLHVRTQADDPGAHLGYSRRTYFFAVDDMLASGWYFLRAPSPERSAFAQDLMTLGIDLSTTAPDAGLSVGYAHTRLFARVPIDASVHIQFRSDLRIEKFSTLPEESSCAIP